MFRTTSRNKVSGKPAALFGFGNKDLRRMIANDEVLRFNLRDFKTDGTIELPDVEIVLFHMTKGRRMFFEVVQIEQKFSKEEIGALEALFNGGSDDNPNQ